MTAITTYPLDGIQYDAKDAAAYFAPRTSGVYSAENCFTVTAAGGYTVRVSSGIGWVHPSDFEGYSIVKTEADTLTLSVADATRPRIDRIVLRYDAAARKTQLQVLEGSPDSNPTAPAISRTALVYDLVLCDILRPAGSTSITAGNLTDTRLDESLCGVMRDAVEGIPTDALLAAAKARIAELEETASASAKQADASQKAAAESEKNAAGSAAEAKQTVQNIDQVKADAVKAVDDERDAALQQVANSTKAAQTAASNAAASEQAAEASKEAAATSAGDAANSATAASGSASAAAASESNAATSAKSANTDADRAEAAAELAGTRANTDKTLTTENAPADAAAVGDYILDRTKETPQPIFYSKTEVEAKIKEILAAQREEDYAKIKFWVSPDPTSPASLFGGTWERIAQDRALMGASDTHSAGTTASAGLPNISGTWGNIRVPSGVTEGGSLPDSDLTGVFKKTIFKSNPLYISIHGTNVCGWDKLEFSASESNPLYGASDTVQPPAYYAYIWRRIA